MTVLAPRVDGAAERGLQRPGAVEALQQLARLVGPADALTAWQEAAAATGCHGLDLEPDALLAVAAALHPRGGMHALFATSLSARVRAWQVLSRAPGGRS